MVASVQLVLVLSTALLAQERQGACPTGWFGRGCTSKCRCRNSITCDAWEGTCPGDGKCQVGYFGPGCQQWDFCNRSTGSEPDYLKDCDDSTCNPDVNAQSVIIEYKYYDVVSFFRIVVNDPKYLRNFTFVTRNPCREPRFYAVSDTAIDLVCTGYGLQTTVTISGPTVGHLCSVHGAIGRNLVQRKRTWQSSNSSDHPEWGLSANAIDENTRNIYDENSSCSQTGVQANPQWGVDFGYPVVLQNLEVYNRNIFQEKLSDLTAMFWYNTSFVGPSYFQYGIQPVRRQPESSHTPMTKVILTIPITSELTLCEVSIRGEFWCLDGIWGLNCDKQCACGENQSCSIHTGACSRPCPVGKYGLKCIRLCSDKCPNGCSEHWGLCKCQPGQTGSVCLPDCPLGTYGATCQFNCSKHCAEPCRFPSGACRCKDGRTGLHCRECPGRKYGDACNVSCSHYCINKCDSVDGSCRCMYNRTGQNCTDCPVGRYGDNCSGLCPVNCRGSGCNISGFCYECEDGFFGEQCDKNCSSTCANSQCDMITGKCFSCLGNLTGDFCTTCPLTYSGELCFKRCSQFCRDRNCHMLTQKCFGCIEGYIGDFCLKEDERTLPYFAILLLLLPLFLILCCCCFIGGKVTIRKEAAEEEENEDDDDDDDDDNDDTGDGDSK